MKKIYKNLNILDGTKDMSLQKNMMITVENGKIVAIEESGNVVGDNVVDLNGKFVTPGLVNLHVHIPATGFPKKKETDNKKLVKILKKSKFTLNLAQKILCNPSAKTELLSGCTTIRAVGGVAYLDSKMRDEIKAGKIIGPRMISCNEAITIPGGHMEGTVAVGANSLEEFAQLVERNIKDGVDWIKIMITGGVLDAKVKGEPGELKMTPEQVKVCCDTAHKHGIKVCAHVESPKGVKVAIENGVDSIEHGSEMTDETVKLFLDNNAALVCTLSPAIPLARFNPETTHADEVVIYNSEVLLQSIIKGVKSALEEGVTVGLGTDTGCPYITHYDMWRELEYYHKFIGVSRKDALYTGTLQNAKILGLDKETGSIEVGKSADFIVMSKNPLDGFDAIRDLDLVVFKGKEYSEKPAKNADCERELDKFLASL